MFNKRVIFSSSILLSGLLLSAQAQAKQQYFDQQPYIPKAVSCTSCHSASSGNESERNANLPYGILFGNTYDDDRGGTVASAFTTIEPFDIDGDGFSNGQEIYGFSNFNTGTSKPLLLGTGVKSHGVVSAKPLVNETIDAVLQAPTTPASVTALIPAGQKNIGGTIDLTLSNLTLSKASPTLLFSTGGIVQGAKAYSIDANGAATAITTATVNNSGSITLELTDEGPYDLYTQASYIASAKMRVPNASTTTATISPYATVSNLAVISPYATINDYATVGAYAIIGDYAIVDTYATVDDYAVVANNATVAANTTQAAPTDYLGVIQTKVAVVTASPPIRSLTVKDDDEGGDGGGLHCMTSGLGLQGLMFLSLFGSAYLLRRKKK